MNNAFRGAPKNQPRAERPSWTPGEQLDAPQPPARTEAAAAIVGENVAIFGGMDATGCLGDLWLYSIAHRLWSLPLVVGKPPDARFGHALVPRLSAQEKSNALLSPVAYASTDQYLRHIVPEFFLSLKHTVTCRLPSIDDVRRDALCAARENQTVKRRLT